MTQIALLALVEGLSKIKSKTDNYNIQDKQDSYKSQEG